MFRRLTVCAALGAVFAGCGPWQRVGSSPQPDATSSVTQLFDMASVYHRLGRLAVGGALPFVGTAAFAAGPGDSTIVLVGLSLENRVLSFTRDSTGFVAHYHVDVAAAQPGRAGITAGRDETVRAPTYSETLRNDESVVYQQELHLLPGTYHLTVHVRDLTSSQQNEAAMDITVPHYPAGTTSEPIVAYEVTGREHQSDSLSVILNPRGTVSYGSDTLLAYIEGYRMRPNQVVPIEIRDQHDNLILRDSLRFTGGQEVEGQVVRLTPDSAPLGELKLVVGTGKVERTTSAIVSLSSDWVVTNYEEMISLLRYFGHQDDLKGLRDAPAADRARLWREFYHKSDPVPTTPENEALDLYFSRLAVADRRFRDEGVAGWRTDRGEVYIQLGEPDEVYDASATVQGLGRVIRWVYVDQRLSLIFQDETGFGRFRLSTTSRAEFERAVDRQRRRTG